MSCPPPCRRFVFGVVVALIGLPPLIADETNDRVLVVVSDDDFLKPNGDLWCQTQLDRAVQSCNEQRNGGTLRLEKIPAGSPDILRGGRPYAGGPRRILCFVCDGRRRILAFCIGVPDAGQLMTFWEDADELAIASTLRDLQKTNAGSSDDDPASRTDALTETVRDRAKYRVSRHYRPLLEHVSPQSTVFFNAEVLSPCSSATSASGSCLIREPKRRVGNPPSSTSKRESTGAKR